MKCPKCGFEQPDDIYCANCGVEVAVYARARSRRNRLLLGIGGGITVAAVASIIFVVFLKGKRPTRVSEPLSVNDASPASNYSGRFENTGESTSPSRHGKTEQPEPTESVPPAQPASSETSKPVPPTVLKNTLKQSRGLVVIPVGKLGGSRNEFRLVSIKDGIPTDVVFQLDNESDLGAYNTVQADDVIFALPSDAGDRDDQVALPEYNEETWVAEVMDKEGGKGWFYLCRDRSFQPPRAAELVSYSKIPEGASTELYLAAFDSDYPVFLDRLNVAGTDLLDRLKLRVYMEDFVLDEGKITGEGSTASSEGPLVARSKWEGSLHLEDEDVPVERTTAYFKDHFVIGYTFDFSQSHIKEGILRIYLDLSDATDGLRLVTADQPEGELIDGQGVAGEHRGNWFIIAGARKALRVTLKGGAGKLVIMDDDSVEDPPESIAGCMGCCGFEFANLKRKIRAQILFEILDWKPGNPLPPPPSNLTATLTLLK